MEATPPLAVNAFMALSGATVTLPSVRFEKEECGLNICKIEHLVQCSFELCVQTGMFKNG
jgi:hypothetical protein